MLLTSPAGLANLAVERKDAKMAMNALLLCVFVQPEENEITIPDELPANRKRCIAARTWDHCAGVLTQIEDVGAKVSVRRQANLITTKTEAYSH